MGCSSDSATQRGDPPTAGKQPSLSCPASSCDWQKLRVPQLGVTMSMTGMAALASDDIWLSGRAGAGWSKPRPGVDATWAPALDHNVILHWDGARWRRISLPHVTSPLTQLAATPSSRVWALAGEHVVEYDGRRWSEARPHLPPLGASGEIGLAVDRTGAWLATTRGTRTGNHPWTARWDGRHWHPVVTPGIGNQSGLTAVASASPADAWVFGFHDTLAGPVSDTTKLSGLLIEHWDGRRWGITPQPVYHNSKRSFFVADAVMVSPTEGWAVGSQTYAGGGRVHPLVLHYDGRSWSIMRFPYCCAGAVLTAIASRGGEVWVAGTGSGPAGYQTLIDRWSGGRWIREPSLDLGGTQSADIDITPSGSVLVLATGQNQDGTSYPLLQRWTGP